MPSWLQKLTRRDGGIASAPEIQGDPATLPAFATKLPVDAPGAPGMAGAEALFRKWSERWLEF